MGRVRRASTHDSNEGDEGAGDASAVAAALAGAELMPRLTGASSTSQQRPAADMDQVDAEGEPNADDNDNDNDESFPTRFHTWAELDAFVAEFGESTYQLFRKRSAVSVAARNEIIQTGIRKKAKRKSSSCAAAEVQYLPEALRWYSKTYICTHATRRRVYQRKTEGPLHTGPLRRAVGCTAKINATLKCDRVTHQYYIRVRVSGWHNHPFGKETYYTYFENRRITDPALIKQVALMIEQKGNTSKVIFSTLSKQIEATGQECFFRFQDVSTLVARLRSERRKKRASSALSEDAGDDDGDAESSAEHDPASGSLSTASHAERNTRLKKRKATRGAVNAEDAHNEADLVAPRNVSRATSLSRIEALLDSSCCYALAYEEIAQVPVVATEILPQTISGFKHEVVPISPSHVPEDVSFVLPKYVLHGCESRIIDCCRMHGLLPPSLGVTLSVQKRDDSRTPIVATLTSRQLKVMKRFHAARQQLRDVKQVIDWIGTTIFHTCPCGPFDDYFHWSKDALIYPVSTLSLTKTVVSGRKTVATLDSVDFVDTIHGASILKFSPHTELDVDCVKAVLLSLHSRFHDRAAFVCPNFTTETDPRERKQNASLYGAFLTPKAITAGLVLLSSTRWGGFFYDRDIRVCFVNALTSVDYEELQAVLRGLFRSFGASVEFQLAPIPSRGANCSGVVALLFVELMLCDKTWEDLPVDAAAYLRIRYMLHAIQVVNKQDVHDVQARHDRFAVNANASVNHDKHATSSSSSSSTRTSAALAEESTPWLVVSSAPRFTSNGAKRNHESVGSANADVRAAARISAISTSVDGDARESGSHDDAQEANGDAAADGDDGDFATSSLESFPTRFYSWDELDEYIHEFGENTYQLFRKRTTVSVAKRNLDITKRIQERKAVRNFKDPDLIPEEWEFYSRTFVCTHGLRNYPRGEGLRTHATIRATGCTARIHATLKYDRKASVHFINTRVSGSHNHTIGKERYYSYAENRKITDPAILRDIAEMSARGEFPKGILAHITKRVRETTGEECVYDLKTIRNIIWRLKRERKDATAGHGNETRSHTRGKEQAAAVPAVQQVAAEALAPEDTPISRETIGSKRKADSTTAMEPDESVVEEEEVACRKPFREVKLSRLEILLNSSYTYLHTHEDVEQVVIAATEMIPNTISGFKHEIIELSPSNKADDVTFVLPKHALAGCENGIVEHCSSHGLLPQAVGVRLPVRKPGSQEAKLVTLSSRQLLVMKRYYLARHNVAETKKVMEWINTTSFSAYPSAPFDEFVDHTKDLFSLALQLVSLSKTVVCGRSFDADVSFGFTDTIYGSSILKFGSASNIDIECVKAVLLHMHARFHAKASFICPSFVFEANQRERCGKASAYGAFLSPKEFVGGLNQLKSNRWGGFLLDCSKKTCYLYAPTDAEYEELQAVVGSLFIEFDMPVDFEVSPSPAVSTSSNDSGILALLFVECMLLNQTWGDSPMDSLDYFRVRYMMQAIQVVNKQDVHEIAWQ